jgi:hypothetical protein
VQSNESEAGNGASLVQSQSKGTEMSSKGIDAISSKQISLYGEHANKLGYLHIEGSQFVRNCDIPELKMMQASYFDLPPDADGGQRFRAHSALRQNNDVIEEAAAEGYAQSKDYNYTEGGKVRLFAPIAPAVRQSQLLRRIIQIDASIVRATGIVPFDGPVKIGLHQVRYQPIDGIPSYSSPPWLHKDDEPAVFVHLVNASANLIGGDSVLAQSAREFQHVLRLQDPLDTLFLTQNLFHAVTPVGIESGPVGFRDILIVTFQPTVAAKLAA